VRALRAVLANSFDQVALPASACWSDRQQLNGLARTARSGPRRLILADWKLAQTCLYVARPKSETGLGSVPHALATQLMRVLVHPSAAQAVLLGNVGGRKKRGLKTVQCLELLGDESR
jgi:hypothetical protein